MTKLADVVMPTVMSAREPVMVAPTLMYAECRR